MVYIQFKEYLKLKSDPLQGIIWPDIDWLIWILVLLTTFFLFCANPSLLIANIVAELTFMISRYPSTPLSRNFEKNKGFYLQDLEIT